MHAIVLVRSSLEQKLYNKSGGNWLDELPVSSPIQIPSTYPDSIGASPNLKWNSAFKGL
jgi:hypothetical protein